MDQLMEILTEVNADVDFETCDTLIDDGILDSFDIVSIVGELNDTFRYHTGRYCSGKFQFCRSNVGYDSETSGSLRLILFDILKMCVIILI